jgi:O-antigen/teichoic acid export membrane protein
LGEKVILGMVCFVVSSLVYAAALVLFQDEIIAILYSDRYRSYVNLVWIVALIPVVQSASSIVSATLNAMERPKAIFWAMVGGATCTATVGLGAVAIAGLLGAIVALLISAGVIMVLLLWFLRVALRNEVADHAK